MFSSKQIKKGTTENYYFELENFEMFSYKKIKKKGVRNANQVQ